MVNSESTIHEPPGVTGDSKKNLSIWSIWSNFVLPKTQWEFWTQFLWDFQILYWIFRLLYTQTSRGERGIKKIKWMKFGQTLCHRCHFICRLKKQMTIFWDSKIGTFLNIFNPALSAWKSLDMLPNNDLMNFQRMYEF